jgi:hypothetical protein
VQIVGSPTVADTAGSITLILQRRQSRGGLKAPEVVSVHTVGITAVPGVDFAPVDQVITLPPRARTAKVTIPIFPDDQSNGTRTFAVTLDHAPVSGNPADSQAVVITIEHPVPRLSPPIVVKTRLLTSADQVTGFMITFNKDMDPAQVQDLSNYKVHGQQAGPSNVVLSQAVYNQAAHTVTLVPAQPVLVRRYVVENPGPGPQSRLTDLAGNALDGVGDGTPNGIFYATFAASGSSYSPVVRARLAADRQLHVANRSNRQERLGESLGYLTLLL